MSNESPLHPPTAAADLLPADWRPEPGEVTEALDSMILSASGWRTVFAADGNEESHIPEVRPVHALLAGLAARAFAEFLREHTVPLTVAVGQDTRPTGSALAQAAIRGLLHEQANPLYVFVSASPEIMAFTRSREGIGGFFYVSASHNPVGHNGLKMGFGDGSVTGGDASRTLINRFREMASDGKEMAKTVAALTDPDRERESATYEAMRTNKEDALAAYARFTREVAKGPGPRADECFDALSAELRAGSPGVVADMNGSARTLTIDEAFLTSMGCRIRAGNSVPGRIAHQIVPEGEGLDECRQLLAEAHTEDKRFFLGYVPDNDGDRGNLVAAARGGDVRQLAAQEVFALACVSELSWLLHTGAALRRDDHTEPRVAVVVNGPTSMRVERIAARFGVDVHRAEVGEANVVARARELRRDGYLVRFLGEGSNGGNITHPAAVRDPIQTILAVLKLLYGPDGPHAEGPARLWLSLAGRPVNTAGTRENAGPLPVLEEILSSLPRFTTTSAFEPLAVMRITARDHGALKSAAEDLWESRWPELAPRLEHELGVTGFRYENYEGTETRPGRGNRSEAGKGGFKILLTDAEGVSRAFLWMRGSGTEPVFRVLVDVEGDHPELERELLNQLRRLVEDADAAAAG